MRTVMFLSLFMVSSCLGSVSVKLNKDNVQFIATPSSYENEIQEGYKVVGQLKITNNSKANITFSNKDLYLVIYKEGEGRTYVDSIASHAIDFKEIIINKGDTLNQNVYWVLPPVKSLKTEQLFLEWRK